jgi:hypothetical protein
MLSTREALKQTAVFGALALVAIAGTIALLWQASDIWAATHGYGTRGTWTATRDGGDHSLIRWYGDFTPDGGGPVRHEVPMEGAVDPGHGKGTVAAVYRSGTAYRLPGSGQWLALTLVALVPLAAGAGMVWLVIQVIQAWRRPRRRLAI